MLCVEAGLGPDWEVGSGGGFGTGAAVEREDDEVRAGTEP